MAFINKFKNKKAEDKVPEGVKVEYSSFGQPQAGYNPTQIQQNFTGNTPSHQNGNNNESKTNHGSFAQTSVWSNDDDQIKIGGNNSNTQKVAKGKPNFMQKSQPQPPAPIQQAPQTQNNTTINTPANVTNTTGQRQEINLKIENQVIPKKVKFEIKNELDLLDDNDMNFPELEFQKKIVNDIVSPGGIRSKQQEDVLNAFAQDCLSLSPCVIGSLLINKLFSNEQNIVKQRALYASEILVKRYPKFQEFYKKQQFMIQKSQQFNQYDQKFVSLSNQLLAVVSNPSLEISEVNDVNFSFSQGKDLSKFGKKNEVPTVQITQPSQNQNQVVNLIDDLLDQPVTNGNSSQTVPQQSQNKSSNLFKNLNKKAVSENPSPLPQEQIPIVPPQQQQPIKQQQGEKGKLFAKFKTKSNNNSSNQNNEGDLLSLIDDQPQQTINNTNNGSQGLEDKFSLLNLYTHDNNNHQSPNTNLNNAFYPPPPSQFNQFQNNQQTGFYPPQPGYHGQQIPGYPPYQNGGYPPYPIQQQQGYGNFGQQPSNQYGYTNNNGYQQNSGNYSTIYMDFDQNKQNTNLESQLYNSNNFNLNDNTPNQKNSKNQVQQNSKPINEDAFDFISL